ncbi:MAG: RloB domain-containing protein [Actinomycetia bacterium]|nr:RloB domain-containing protein [Actinomycetes bacterium]
MLPRSSNREEALRESTQAVPRATTATTRHSRTDRRRGHRAALPHSPGPQAPAHHHNPTRQGLCWLGSAHPRPRGTAPKKRASKRRRKSDGPDFDEIWCAFDTDEHLNMAQAIAEARDAEVKVARSNPCSELWPVLHVEDHNANVHRHDIQRRATDLGLADGKSICGTEAEETLMANTQSAVDRAQHLDDRHGNDGSPAGENPSSGMWRLVEAIEQNK